MFISNGETGSRWSKLITSTGENYPGESQLTLGATSGTGVSATLSTSASATSIRAKSGDHIYMNLGSVPAGSTGVAVVTSVSGRHPCDGRYNHHIQQAGLPSW